LGVPNYRALESDPGLFALTKEDADWGAFRTAPLREVGRTAPYMHNGVLETLEEVVRFYNESDDLGLSGAEIEQLVAFLESLSSEPVEVELPPQPDYQLRTLGDNR
jgi:cytochrome c peroxidase